MVAPAEPSGPKMNGSRLTCGMSSPKRSLIASAALFGLAVTWGALLPLLLLLARRLDGVELPVRAEPGGNIA